LDYSNGTVLVLHPAGNVAEHLVANGLARVVDWHAGMLASGGGMERLRAAERTAKERKVCLYANAPAIASSKSTGATSASRVFDATVIRVWSGDQISVVEKEGSKERRLQLSSTRGPKCVWMSSLRSKLMNYTEHPIPSKLIILRKLASTFARGS
jgi:staphylococcal nuclease domain-containing protein 1